MHMEGARSHVHLEKRKLREVIASVSLLCIATYFRYSGLCPSKVSRQAMVPRIYGGQQAEHVAVILAYQLGQARWKIFDLTSI